MGRTVVKVWPGLDCPNIASAGIFSCSWRLTFWLLTNGYFLGGPSKCEILKKSIIPWSKVGCLCFMKMKSVAVLGDNHLMCDIPVVRVTN